MDNWVKGKGERHGMEKVDGRDRREVAARLRINAERSWGVDRDALRYAIGLAPFVVDDDTTLGEIDESDSETWGNLADLIDPTCHIVRVDDTYNTPETGRVDEWHYECSKCGIELDDNDADAMDSGAKPFDYCPNCGARCVDDAEVDE